MLGMMTIAEPLRLGSLGEAATDLIPRAAITEHGPCVNLLADPMTSFFLGFAWSVVKHNT